MTLHCGSSETANTKISSVQDRRSTLRNGQTVPTSKSRDTKTRPNIKNPAHSNLDIVP